eukprot:XP_001696915.1 predicted protein [Chlamydomonas reinhardtii]
MSWPAYRQFPGLASKFDLRGVFMPPEDRTPFAGACVDRLVLVNPATSFDRSPWPALGPLLPSLPADAYKLLPVALSPILSNPISMARRAAAPGDPLPQQAVDLLYGLLDLIPELSSLRVVLPPQTLAWRLQLLAEGAAAVNPTLGKVKPRTLLLVGSNDLVIPSAAEAPRLERALPRCTSRTLQGGSHALLQESEVDLLRIIQEEDFYVSRRGLTRPNVPAGFNPDTATRPAPGGANFGTPGPLELPTPGELRRAVEGGGLGGLKRLVSPVYLSTDAASGRVVVGLDRLPLPRSGPMLFVGNHQLFGELSNSRFGRFLETFGAVPVSGRNLYQLLAAGEAALLYPGGVEGCLGYLLRKRESDPYKDLAPRLLLKGAYEFCALAVPSHRGDCMIARRRDSPLELLPQPPPAAVGPCLLLRLRLGGQELTAACAHLAPFAENAPKRMQQIARIVAAAPSELPLLLAGDMNMREKETPAAGEVGLMDAWVEAGSPPGQRWTWDTRTNKYYDGGHEYTAR